MAAPKLDFSARTVIDPYKGLQTSVLQAGELFNTTLRDREASKLRREELEYRRKRDEEATVIRNEQLGWKREDRADKLADEEFLRTNRATPYIGGKGLDRTALKSFSELGGDYISNLDKVKVGADGSLIPASPEDVQNPSVSTFPNVTPSIGSDIEARMRTLNPTQERVYASMYDKTLAGTGDVGLAEKVAKTASSKYLSRKDVLDAEATSTKQAESLRKELVDQAKYSVKSKGTTGAGSSKASSKSKGSIPTGWLNRLDAKKEIASWGIGGFDEGSALDLFDMAVGADRDPKRVLEVIKNNATVGVTFGDNDVDLTKAELLQQVDALEDRYPLKRSGSTNRVKGKANITPAERAIIFSTPNIARGYNEIQQDLGRSAWGNLGRDLLTPTQPVTRPPREDLPPSRTDSIIGASQAKAVSNTLPLGRSAIPLVDLQAEADAQNPIKVELAALQSAREVTPENFNRQQELRKLLAAEKYSSGAMRTRQLIGDYINRPSKFDMFDSFNRFLVESQPPVQRLPE